MELSIGCALLYIGRLRTLHRAMSGIAAHRMHVLAGTADSQPAVEAGSARMICRSEEQRMRMLALLDKVWPEEDAENR